jgi:cytochrome c peroxidase
LAVAGVSDLTCKGPNNTGEELFKCETFGGNGRTCSTCHSDRTGTFSPEEAQARFATNPNDPLFVPLDSDDGIVGLSYTRLMRDATVRVTIPLPPNVVMLDDPTARTVTFFRSTPSTLNMPALDPVIMWDGRAPDLQHQAVDAVVTHAQPPSPLTLPNATQQGKIAAFQRTLFSSPVLREFARGGPAPVLPEGNTDSEKRGRLFFLPGTFERPTIVGASAKGICAACHAGPMLNQISTGFVVANDIPCPAPELQDAGLPCPDFSVPREPGSRFMTSFVSDFNEAGNVSRKFLFMNPDGTMKVIDSPDPGLALITGDVRDFNLFKIPTLWNAANTAPYFHDNSAKSLEDLVAHYDRFFQIAFFGRIVLTPQEKQDIVAYMKLLENPPAQR